MPTLLHLIAHLDQIEALAGEWRALADRCRLAAPFCGPDSWIPWLKAHPQFEPAVYEWRKGGELCALLPFFRKGHHLEMAAGPHLDYQDIAATGTDAAVSALLAIAVKEEADASKIVFPKVAAGSRLARALEDPRIGSETHHEARYWSHCAVATIETTPGRDFFAAIPTRQRKDYRNASRRISEAHPEHLVEHHGPGHFSPALLDEVAALHRANQYRKTGVSVFADPSFERFLKEQAASGSPLCLSLLRESPGGPLMAFHLGYFNGQTFFYYLTSYAAEYAHLSAGRWLLVDALKHWHERALGTTLRFDMLCGEEEYKSRWTEEGYEVNRVVLIPKRLANLPRILAYSAVYGLKNAKNRHLLGRHGGGRNEGEHVPQPEPGDVVLPG
jgi:CelD/BcsL family acetyltransferase involved in cellulose biosynthesis